MTEAEARALLVTMVAPDNVPVLTAPEVDALLVWGRRADISGRAPSDAAWVGGWDLNAAAAEGWRRKAGKVAGSFDFGTDGQSFSRSQMLTMCLEMATRYQRSVIVSAKIGTDLTPVGGVTFGWYDTIGNVNCG